MFHRFFLNDFDLKIDEKSMPCGHGFFIDFLIKIDPKSIKIKSGVPLGYPSVLDPQNFWFSYILNRFLTPLGTPLGGQVGVQLRALARPGASGHLPGRSLRAPEPFFSPSHEQYFFQPHFTPLSTPKMTPKINKKSTKNYASVKHKNKAFSPYSFNTILQ